MTSVFIEGGAPVQDSTFEVAKRLVDDTTKRQAKCKKENENHQKLLKQPEHLWQQGE